MPILAPIFLFKGQLNATSFRSKTKDVHALVFLIRLYSQTLSSSNDQINLMNVGRVMQRYPLLQEVFSKLHIDVAACHAAAAVFDVAHESLEDEMIHAMTEAAIQKALIFGLPNPIELVPTEGHVWNGLPAGAISYPDLHRLIQTMVNLSEYLGLPPPQPINREDFHRLALSHEQRQMFINDFNQRMEAILAERARGDEISVADD